MFSYETNVDCVFRKYIRPKGANLINVGLNPSQYLYDKVPLKLIFTKSTKLMLTNINETSVYFSNTVGWYITIRLMGQSHTRVITLGSELFGFEQLRAKGGMGQLLK